MPHTDRTAIHQSQHKAPHKTTGIYFNSSQMGMMLMVAKMKAFWSTNCHLLTATTQSSQALAHLPLQNQKPLTLKDCLPFCHNIDKLWDEAVSSVGFSITHTQLQWVSARKLCYFPFSLPEPSHPGTLPSAGTLGIKLNRMRRGFC